MTPLAQRIATAVNENSPRVTCLTCLAAQQGVKEHDVRGVALMLIVRANLRFMRRRCSSCHRVGDVLLARNVA